MKLSFIIPFYNGKKYIAECLDSLYQQDIPINEYEVLIVDDCSNDGESLTLLTILEAKYPHLRIIHNERNCRCGESRNHGVREAKGQYLWFVDQDDYIAPHCLKDLLHICETSNLDMLTFDFCDVNDQHQSSKRNVVSHNTSVLSGLAYIQDVCCGDFWCADYDTNVWHTIFRRDFMVENKIYSPAVSYCEDMIVAQHAIICAKRMQAITKNYYCYRNNPNSVYHTEVGKKGRPIFDASLYAGTEILKLSQLVPTSFAELKKIVFEAGVGRLNIFTKNILKITPQERDSFYNQITLHSSVISTAEPYLTSTNKWLISHSNIVKRFPHLIYAYIKLKEL